MLHALCGGELCQGSCRRAVRIPIDLRMPPASGCAAHTHACCLHDIIHLNASGMLSA